MTPVEAAWVRAHAWPPKARRRGADLVPGNCSCNDSACFPCTRGWHHECFTAKHGPDADMFLAPVNGWSGEQVSQVVCGPGQRLCVFVCPCGCRDEQPVAAVPKPRRPPRPLARGEAPPEIHPGQTALPLRPFQPTLESL